MKASKIIILIFSLGMMFTLSACPDPDNNSRRVGRPGGTVLNPGTVPGGGCAGCPQTSNHLTRALGNSYNGNGVQVALDLWVNGNAQDLNAPIFGSGLIHVTQPMGCGIPAGVYEITQTVRPGTRSNSGQVFNMQVEARSGPVGMIISFPNITWLPAIPAEFIACHGEGGYDELVASATVEAVLGVGPQPMNCGMPIGFFDVLNSPPVCPGI